MLIVTEQSPQDTFRSRKPYRGDPSKSVKISKKEIQVRGSEVLTPRDSED